MAKGQRLKPEQIVTLLRQIDVLRTNTKRAKPLPLAAQVIGCKRIKPNTSINPNSTNFAARIYYKKTFFGRGTKMITVQ